MTVRFAAFMVEFGGTTEFGLPVPPDDYRNTLPDGSVFRFLLNDFRVNYVHMKRADLGFAVLLIPLDYVALVAAAAAAYAIRFASTLTTIRPVIFELSFERYMSAVLPFALVIIGIFAVSGLYSIHPRRLATEMTRVILAVSTGVAAILGVAFFSRALFESRFIVLAVWALAIVFVIMLRILLRLIQRSLRRYGIGTYAVAIIGKTKSGNELKRFFAARPGVGYHVVVHVTSFNAETRERLLTLRKHGKLDAVLLADTETPRAEITAIKAFTDTEHVTFLYSADLFTGSTLRPIMHTFAEQPVIEVPKTPLDGWGAIYKRGFDIVASAILIVITLPLQILIAIAIVIENPGPIFFSRPRVGQAGKHFSFLKFRSMVRDAHALRFDPNFVKQYGNERAGTPLFKIKDDPRTTRVGRFIRAWSLDEIPQFYLVFLGSMSLVGPRPHLPEEVAMYKPHQRKVLTIKPGITGMAQVSGRAALDFEDEVRLDMYYIENWSPWLDLVIALKTPLAILWREGAS